MTATLWLLSLIVAFGVGWAAASLKVGHGEAASGEHARKNGSTPDLEPCEHTTFWEARQ